MIVGRVVTADTLPIDGLGCEFGIGETLDDRGVTTLSIRPILLHNGNAGKAHFQVYAELVLWQITLEPPSLFTVRFQNEHGRRPNRVKPAKVLRVFFDMYL